MSPDDDHAESSRWKYRRTGVSATARTWLAPEGGRGEGVGRDKDVGVSSRRVVVAWNQVPVSNTHLQYYKNTENSAIPLRAAPMLWEESIRILVGYFLR